MWLYSVTGVTVMAVVVGARDVERKEGEAVKTG
jgi:hypothetical protein